MSYVVTILLGMGAGAVCAYLALEQKRKQLQEERRLQVARERRLSYGRRQVETQRQEEAQRAAATAEEHKALRLEVSKEIERLKRDRTEFETRAVSYKELQDENALLKRDLRNLDVNLRKLQLDREQQRQTQEALDQKGRDLGGRYLKENVKWLSSSLNAANFVKCKDRLQNVIESCREIGYGVSDQEQASLLADLKTEYEKVVRAAFEREEQVRIKARIREEQALEREVERELKQLERERAAIRTALDKALAEARDEHSAEVERLKARLAEAEEKSQRAVSQAQMTKSGHVYVISNIGSFGDGVFKIGMTRRLEPLDRVRELGDASVPFPFDVHMMISSNDAPALENALHHTLHKQRLNKINPRKEFFRAEIEAIRQIVQEHHGEVQYVAEPEALEYHQSLTISDEDEEYIESVYDKLAYDEEKPSSED